MDERNGVEISFCFTIILILMFAINLFAGIELFFFYIKYGKAFFMRAFVHSFTQYFALSVNILFWGMGLKNTGMQPDILRTH